MIIPITKTTDLCLGLKDTKKKNNPNSNIKDSNKEKENAKKESKLEVSGNYITSFDSLNNSSASNITDKIDIHNIINQYIPLNELNEENYPYLKETEIKENDKNVTNTNLTLSNFNEKDFNIFIDYIKKKHYNKK